MNRNEFTQNQERWLTALESGEYEQTRDALANDHGTPECAYCCLGVAVHLYDPKHYSLALGDWDLPEAAEVLGVSEDEVLEEWGVPDKDASPEVADSLHLTSASGRFRFRWLGGLAVMNDDGFSFAEIAAFIRREPWQVFTNFDRPEASPEHIFRNESKEGQSDD